MRSAGKHTKSLGAWGESFAAYFDRFRPHHKRSRSGCSRPSRLLKKSPRAGFEAGFIAIVETDLAGERPVCIEFGEAVAAGFVHFVMTLPGEVGPAAACRGSRDATCPSVVRGSP